MVLFSLINAKAYCYYEKVGYNDDCGNCIAMEQSGYIIKWEKNGENKKRDKGQEIWTERE